RREVVAGLRGEQVGLEGPQAEHERLPDRGDAFAAELLDQDGGVEAEAGDQLDQVAAQPGVLAVGEEGPELLVASERRQAQRRVRLAPRGPVEVVLRRA